MFVRPFYNKATRKLYKLFSLPLQIQNEKEHEEWLVLNTIKDTCFTPLTREEKRAVKRFWGIEPHSYKEYEVFKTFNGFDVRFMQMSIYLPLITRRLNDYQYTELFEHKSLLG